MRYLALLLLFLFHFIYHCNMIIFSRLNVIIIIVAIWKINSCYCGGELFPFLEPKDCEPTQYFATSWLTCRECPKDKLLVPSQNKFACVCNNRSRTVSSVGEFPTCEICGSNEEVSEDGKLCLPCSNNTTCSKPSVKRTVCEQNEILVDRDISGISLGKKKCVKCAPNFQAPSFYQQSSCLPCSFPNCICSNATHELLPSDLCVSKTELSSVLSANFIENQYLYTVEFYKSEAPLQSHYLKTHLQPALYKCLKLRSSQSCQMIANLCVLTLHKDDGLGSSACNIFREYKYIPTSMNTAHSLPWIYYGDGDGASLLSRKKIDARYSLMKSNPNHLLNFTLAKYSIDGQFLGFSSARGEDLHLCPGTGADEDEAFRFGARYYRNCVVHAQEITNSAKRLQFYDLYLHLFDKSKPTLYAVPIIIKNIRFNNVHPNRGTDESQWLLTRRFFLVDDVSGVSYSVDKLNVISDNKPTVVRYLKSAKLLIKLRRDRDEEGKIYPPFLILDYGELSSSDIRENIKVKVEFIVDYYMENNIPHIIDVTIGVLSAAVVIWSGLQTWTCCRRNGQMAIDTNTLLEFLINSCGCFSNMFLLVAAILSLHTIIFYKAQTVAYVMLPTHYIDKLVIKYIIVAFCLKIVEIVKLVHMQMKMDIFLIDWERPKATSPIVLTDVENNQSEPSISIWRSYFVANEWNELQTRRRTSLIFQLLFTLFILKICGVENWTQAMPDFNFHHEPNRPESVLLRCGTALTVYLFVYTLQWFLMVGIYETYVSNCIQEFVDICSTANISVFLLLYQNYGYYIHGRSPHGFADTNMSTILAQMKREAENLVGHRGLVPGTQIQTFEMIIPTALRVYYDKVANSIDVMSKQPINSSFRLKAVDYEEANNIVDAYVSMNRFLSAFIDHALKDLDYEVREKLFVERLLDIEFTDSLDRGIFYIDNRHSFDNALFYGNEITLFSFDLIMFLCADVLFQNTILSAIITMFLNQVIVGIRHFGGRRNLAKKTLIDDRFLI